MQIQSRLTAISFGAAPSATRSVSQGAASAAGTSTTKTPLAPTAKAPTVYAASTTPQLTTVQSARQKINADYAKANAEGTRVVADIANGGRFLDLTALSDDEVATAALNRDGSFTADEKLTASAELAGRMWKALGPFDTGNPDNTGVQVAIKAIYPTLSKDVRDALGWTPAMLSMGDRIIDATPPGKEAHRKSLLELLAKGQQTPGALKIDVILLQAKAKGSVVNITG